jgi:hypothetical protein
MSPGSLRGNDDFGWTTGIKRAQKIKSESHEGPTKVGKVVHVMLGLAPVKWFESSHGKYVISIYSHRWAFS